MTTLPQQHRGGYPQTGEARPPHARRPPQGQHFRPPTGTPVDLPAALEAHVLPVFYYNDLLVSSPRDPIGLNLFEPRYQEMCRRMRSDPRFLFMPNFEDYQCRVGDVGLVIRLLEMRSQQRSFGIRGVAEEYVAVAGTWVEAGTHGLHFARFWPLGSDVSPLSTAEMLALRDSMLQQGWKHDDGNVMSRMALRQIDVLMDDGGETDHVEMSQVLFGMNWPRCAFPLFQPGALGNAKRDWELLRTLWANTLASRPGELPDSVMVPAADPGVHLVKALHELLRAVEVDGAGVRMLEGLPEQGLPGLGDWKQLLQKVRISAIHGSAVSMDTVRVELCESQVSRSQDCFPLIARDPGSQYAVVSNGTNVFFFAQVHAIKVTAASADAALGELTWRLNRHRLRILLRARATGTGPLAALEEDVVRLVCEFLCIEPS